MALLRFISPTTSTIVGGAYIDAGGEVLLLTPQLFIAGSRWRFARSMPEAPHSYTVRDLVNPSARRSSCLSHDTFEWFVRHIREEGTSRKFGGRSYLYFAVGDQEYWTMGYDPEVTTIINRQHVDPEVRKARALSDHSANSRPGDQ